MPDSLPTRRPVFARHAASLVVVRNSRTGPEVLMGRRAPGHRFLPNFLVFPGGAVDPGDRTAPAATEPRAATLALLERNAPPKLARALAMAAARELAEETGLSLGSAPRLDTLDYLCRAVTPTRSPIRFNARFLTAPAEALEGTVQETEELHAIRFYRVADVMAEGLMQVTQGVLRQLLAWIDVPAALRDEGTDLQVFRKDRWEKERARPVRV